MIFSGPQQNGLNEDIDFLLEELKMTAKPKPSKIMGSSALQPQQQV